jgi:hypothetical protein
MRERGQEDSHFLLTQQQKVPPLLNLRSLLDLPEHPSAMDNGLWHRSFSWRG